MVHRRLDRLDRGVRGCRGRGALQQAEGRHALGACVEVVRGAGRELQGEEGIHLRTVLPRCVPVVAGGSLDVWVVELVRTIGDLVLQETPDGLRVIQADPLIRVSRSLLEQVDGKYLRPGGLAVDGYEYRIVEAAWDRESYVMERVQVPRPSNL